MLHRCFAPGIVRAPAGAAAPTIRDSIITGIGSSTDPHDLDTSTLDWASGDITLAFSSLPSTCVINSIAGQDGTGADTYAELEALTGTNTRFFVHQGTITSPFDATTRFDLSFARRVSLGVVNVQGASAIDVQSAGETGTSTTPTSASVNTTVNNCLVLSIFGCGGGHVAGDITYPTGWTGLAKVSSGDLTGTETNQATLGVAYKTQATAGATGAAAWGGLTASVAWCASTIALEP